MDDLLPKRKDLDGGSMNASDVLDAQPVGKNRNAKAEVSLAAMLGQKRVNREVVFEITFEISSS